MKYGGRPQKGDYLKSVEEISVTVRFTMKFWEQRSWQELKIENMRDQNRVGKTLLSG